MNNNLIDSFDFFVYPREVNSDKRMHLPHLGACILDAAGLSAKKRGFGMDIMHAQHKAWVVSRMSIEIDEYPHEYDTMTIRTWVNKISHAASTRLFTISDSKGAVIAKASTIWSIIDTDTRRIADLMETTDLSDFVVEEATVGLQSPRRIEIPKEGETKTAEHKVIYSDIDMNCHVNSMKYLQWCTDLLPIEWYQKNKIRRCNINFAHEIRANQTAQITQYLRAKTDDNPYDTYIFDICHEETSCCRIKLDTTD